MAALPSRPASNRRSATFASSTAWFSRRGEEQSPIATSAGTVAVELRAAARRSTRSFVRTTTRSASVSDGSPVTASARATVVPSTRRDGRRADGSARRSRAGARGRSRRSRAGSRGRPPRAGVSSSTAAPRSARYSAALMPCQKPLPSSTTAARAGISFTAAAEQVPHGRRRVHAGVERELRRQRHRAGCADDEIRLVREDGVARRARRRAARRHRGGRARARA